MGEIKDMVAQKTRDGQSDKAEVGHTKGPWEIKHQYNVFAGERLVASCGGHTKHPDPDGVTVAENEANARLIAAGPELLEACRAALRHINLSTTARAGLKKTLRAAVNKAENGE